MKCLQIAIESYDYGPVYIVSHAPVHLVRINVLFCLFFVFLLTFQNDASGLTLDALP